MLNDHVAWWQRLHLGLREWRRRAKSSLPYVRRRVFRRLEQRHDELAAVFLGGMPPATSAAVHRIKDLANPLAGEVCLFVTHAPSATLKPQVVEHLAQLFEGGVQVLLVINTDLPADAFDIDASLLARLSACVLRENLGLDFAAWAHLRALYAERLQPTRLWLVNDSIVGPLDATAYQRLLQRVRASQADMVGITENFDPRYHLQSFYLVFNEAALAPLYAVFDQLVNLPTKDLVIDVYETRLTQHLLDSGLRCEALFPTPARSVHAPPNDTDLRWAALIAAGFPFVKASVLTRLREDPAMLQAVPERFRPR